MGDNKSKHTVLKKKVPNLNNCLRTLTTGYPTFWEELNLKKIQISHLYVNELDLNLIHEFYFVMHTFLNISVFIST